MENSANLLTEIPLVNFTKGLDPGLLRGLQIYGDCMLEVDRHRQEPLYAGTKRIVPSIFKYLRFLISRGLRIRDLSSTEMESVSAIKAGLFPYGPPMLICCSDVRVSPKHHSGLQGRGFRTAGGMVEGFVPKHTDGSIVLDPSALYAQMISATLQESKQTCEIFDSHVACAARLEAEVRKTGIEPRDGGLRADVLEKMAQAQAITKFVASKFPGKDFLVIQTTFDPNTGYMYMGLEEPGCIMHQEAQIYGYTPNVLMKLSKDKLAISTNRILQDSSLLQELFRENCFTVDYDGRYLDSTICFWKAIAQMAEKSFPVFEKALIETRPLLQHANYQPELRQRAVILLANCFSGYLHNQTGEYAYKHHNESVIVITKSEKGPYAEAFAFAVFPDASCLRDNTLLGYRIVRKNRSNMMISEAEQLIVREIYPNASDYVDAPVPLMCFERMPSITLDVSVIQQTNWSDLPDIDWYGMNESDFASYVEHKIPDISAKALRTIEKLRQRARHLIKPGHEVSELILRGKICPLYILAGPDRRSLALLPFLTVGFRF